MAKVVFKSYNQNDNLLFPPCLGDFIADNDPVRVLNAVVDHLDIRSIEDSYEGGGGRRQSPREGVSTLGSSEGGARRMQVIA